MITEGSFLRYEPVVLRCRDCRLEEVQRRNDLCPACSAQWDRLAKRRVDMEKQRRRMRDLAKEHARRR